MSSLVVFCTYFIVALALTHQQNGLFKEVSDYSDYLLDDYLFNISIVMMLYLTCALLYWTVSSIQFACTRTKECMEYIGKNIADVLYYGVMLSLSLSLCILLLYMLLVIVIYKEVFVN